MRYVSPAIALAGALAVAACSSLSTTTTKIDNPTNLSLAITSLTVAERAALVYTSLPACPHSGLCADPIIKAKIKAADNTAYNAVVAAYNNPALVNDAISAVNALSALIPAPSR